MKTRELILWIVLLSTILGLGVSEMPLAQEQTITTSTFTIVLTTTQYLTTLRSVTITTTERVTNTSTRARVTVIETIHQKTTATSTSFTISTVQVPFREAYLDARTIFIWMGLEALLTVAVLIYVVRTAIKNSRKSSGAYMP